MQAARLSIESLRSKERMATLAFILLCLLLALAFPAPIERSPEALPLEHSAAPWIFWPIQTLLLVLPTWLAGLLIPAFIILILLGLPWLNRIPSKSRLKLGTALISLVLLSLFVLMLLSIFIYRVNL